MMDWEKDIELEEVLDYCTKVVNQEIEFSDLEEWWKEHIKVRFYLPAGEKAYVVDRILNKLSYATDFVDNSVFLEMNKFWCILLEYTNIDNTNEDLFTVDNYDIMFPNLYIGLINQVGIDYQIVEKILDNAINFTNLNTLMSLGDTLEKTDLKKIAKLDKDILNLLKNQELVKDLSNIAQASTSVENKAMENILQKEMINIVQKSVEMNKK